MMMIKYILMQTKKKLFDFYLNSMSHLKSKSSSKCYIKMNFIVHKIIMMHAEIVRKKIIDVVFLKDDGKKCNLVG